MEPNAQPPTNPPTQYACLISTNLGQRAPRSIGKPPYPPVIVRSDRPAAIKDFAGRIKEKYPETCRHVFPGCHTKDLFDDYDIHVEEGTFLDDVIRKLAVENIGRVKGFARAWSDLNRIRLPEVAQLYHTNPLDPLAIVEQRGLFTPEQIHFYGRDFLWHAINEMKRAMELVAEDQKRAKLKQDTEMTPKQLPTAVVVAPSEPQQQGRQVSGGHPLERVDSVQHQPSQQKRGKGGKIHAPTPLQPANPEVRRILSGEQTKSSYTPGTAPQYSGTMSLPHTPSLRPATLHAPSVSSLHLPLPFDRPAQQVLQLSSGHAENMGPRGPAGHQRLRQTSSTAQSPRYPHPVEAVRMQGPSLRPSPLQSHPSLANSASGAIMPIYMPAHSYAGQPFGPQSPQPAQMIVNPNMMQGISPDGLPTVLPGQVVYQMADATNTQYPSGTFIPMNMHPSYFQGTTAATAMPAKQPQLYDPYGDANPGFAQIPRGKGKGKNSFTSNSGKGRKFSSGSFGRGGQGPYGGDGGYQQGASYQGADPYGATQMVGNFQNQGQQGYRGARKQGSQGNSGQWSAGHGSRHTSGSRPQGMEPFPAFEIQPSHPQALGLADPRVPPSQATKPNPSVSRHSFGANIAEGQTGSNQGLIMPIVCGPDWIGPDAKHVTELWVHGVNDFPDPEMGLKELFEKSVGVPVLNVEFKTDRNGNGYAFITFRTHKEAEKALTMHDTLYQGRNLTVRVPDKFFKELEPRTSRFGSGSGPRHESGSGYNSSRHPSNSFGTNSLTHTSQGRSYGFNSPKMDRNQRRSSQDPTAAWTSKPTPSSSDKPYAPPTYSPQDARSDLNQQPSQDNFATRGSPEMKKGKKSAKSSPMEVEQQEAETEPTQVSQNPTPTPDHAPESKEIPGNGLANAADKTLSPEPSSSSKQTSATVKSTRKLQRRDLADADAQASKARANSVAQSSNGSDASTIVVMRTNQGSHSDPPADSVKSNAQPQDDGAIKLEEGMSSTTTTAVTESGEGVSSSREIPSDAPVKEPDAKKDTTQATHEICVSESTNDIGSRGLVVATADHSRLSVIDDSLTPLTLMFKTAPQTPMDAYHTPESPATDAVPKDDSGSDDEEQKHDNSFVSAKEDQSDGEGEAHRSQGQGEDQALDPDSHSAPKATIGSEVDYSEPGHEEQPVDGSNLADTHNVTGSSAASPTSRATITQTAKQRVSQTESLHPFAKANKRKEQAKKKSVKKKGKGKETQPKGKESGVSKPVEPTSSEAVPEDKKLGSEFAPATSKAQGRTTSHPSSGSSSQTSPLAKPMENGEKKSDEGSSVKIEVPEPDSDTGKHHFPSSTKAPIPAASSSQAQQAVVKDADGGSSSEPMSRLPSPSLQVQSEKVTKADKEKVKRLKALSAKVAVPNLKLAAGRKSQSTGKSTSPEPRSPLSRDDLAELAGKDVQHMPTPDEANLTSHMSGRSVAQKAPNTITAKNIAQPLMTGEPSRTGAMTPASSETGSTEVSTLLLSPAKPATEDSAVATEDQPTTKAKKSGKKNRNKKRKKKAKTEEPSQSAGTSQSGEISDSSEPIGLGLGAEFNEQFKEIADLKAGKDSFPSYYNRDHAHTGGEDTSNALWVADHLAPYDTAVVLKAKQLEEIQRKGHNFPPHAVIDELFAGADPPSDKVGGSKASGSKVKGG